MAINLPKSYNQLLELMHLSPIQRLESLRRIFDRDISDNHLFRFRGKQINPVKRSKDGSDLDTLFHHLTTETVDKATRKREYEPRRCERLHWLRHHIEEKKDVGVLVFSVEDSDGPRTYIFDEAEQYVIVLAPFRDLQEYYLLTAHYLEGRNPDKIRKKYLRRLANIV